MTHFVVYITEKRKRKHVADLIADSLDIGSRSTCGLTLQDPVAAERHCEIRYDERNRTFVVKDLGTTTGTYVNGIRVGATGAPLGAGDAVVLGASRLLASVEAEETGPALHLELQEKAFQFQRAEFVRQTGDWIQGDRERWVESEVTFSRFALLRRVVWASLLVVVLAPLLLVSGNLRARAFEPGPLSAAHAAVLSGTSLLSASHADVAAQGCRACHEPLAGVPLDHCYACHDATRFSHPFQDANGIAEGAPNSCLECHVEHGGGGTERRVVELGGAWEGRSVSLPVRTGGFVPTADAALCERCHPGLEFDPGRRDRILASVGAREAPTRSVKIAYDAFSHASHLGASIECKVCHMPRVSTESGAGTDPATVLAERDFAPMGFEGCMGCHGTEDMPSSLRTPVARGETSAEPPAFPVAWHGAQDDPGHCQVCHAEAYAGEMRTVPRELFEYVDATGKPITRSPDDPMLLFAYSIRHHTRQFEEAMRALDPAARGSDDDCARCHVDGDWLSAGESREGRFYHALHLAQALSLAQVDELEGEDAERLAASAAACDECHSQIMDSAALAEPYYRAEEQSCVACHRTAPGDESAVPRLIDAAARMRPAKTTERVAFPHDAHTNSDHPTLAAGCYACHGFERSEVAFRDPVVTPESVRDCTKCHDADHGNIGAGSCSRCHSPGDPVYTTRLEDADWPLHKAWPGLNTFNHFSAGHAAAVEADCTRCHEGTQQAGTITALRLPVENDAACRSCHIEEMGRFHWR